jgi:hypothetical protein
MEGLWFPYTENIVKTNGGLETGTISVSRPPLGYRDAERLDTVTDL